MSLELERRPGTSARSRNAAGRRRTRAPVGSNRRSSSYYENSLYNVWSGNGSGGASMSGTTDGVLPTAADAALKVVEAEAAKAEEHNRAKAAAEAEKKL